MHCSGFMFEEIASTPPRILLWPDIRRHCATLGTTGPGYRFLLYSFDDTGTSQRRVLAVTLIRKSCQLIFTLSLVCFLPRRTLFSCTSSRQHATVLCTLVAQARGPVGQVVLISCFDQPAIRTLSADFFASGRASNPHAIMYVSGREMVYVSPCSASEAARQAPFGSSHDWSGIYLSSCSLSRITSSQSTSQARLVTVVRNHSRSTGQSGYHQWTQRLYDWRIIKFLFVDGYAEKVQVIRHVFRAREREIEGGNSAPCAEHVKSAGDPRQRDVQNNWVFYDYHPHVVSILGEEVETGRVRSFEHKEARRNSVVSNLYDGSCDDSGIDIEFFRGPITHTDTGQQGDDALDKDDDSQLGGTTANGSRQRDRDSAHTTSSTPNHRWSMDEMITLTLLDAVHSRNRASIYGNLHDGQLSTKKGRKMSLRRAVVSLFQRLRLV
ncbi:hypothetical protein AX15_000345 [Amanita polypyramis BW_CC]|nr:hypothetical protein AX15_000345 [Amanita polypyramis BW_CC]